MEKNLERKIVINKIITKKFWWGKLKRNTNITHISKLILETINFFFCIYKKWLKTIKKFFISFCINVWKCFINIIKQNKEKLQNEAREKYQNLSKEEKEKRQKKKKAQDKYKKLSGEEKGKKCQYHFDPNKNLFEDEKQKKVEYMRNYYFAHKVVKN